MRVSSRVLLSQVQAKPINLVSSSLHAPNLTAGRYFYANSGMNIRFHTTPIDEGPDGSTKYAAITHKITDISLSYIIE